MAEQGARQTARSEAGGEGEADSKERGRWRGGGGEEQGKGALGSAFDEAAAMPLLNPKSSESSPEATVVLGSDQ